jgi:hypothetical protein
MRILLCIEVFDRYVPLYLNAQRRLSSFAWVPLLTCSKHRFHNPQPYLLPKRPDHCTEHGHKKNSLSKAINVPQQQMIFLLMDLEM